MIEDARPGCPDLRWVVLLGSADWLALPDSGGNPRALAAALAARQALLSPDDPINIQYTSGTTGHPKGATLSHHNILNNAHLTGEILGYTELDRICVSVPLYHTFGMVIGNLGPPHTALAWSTRHRPSTRRPRWRRWRRSAAPRCTACPPCSSPSWPSPASMP